MTIDFLLISGGIILLLAGLLGAFIPVLPGPPLSFAGLLLIHFTSYTQIPSNILLTLGVLALLITIADFLLPIWGTRLKKGSKHGVMGATIGLVIGIFFLPPVGAIIGPLAGAWVAEKTNGKDNRQAWHSAIGSFVGLLLGVVLKLAISLAMIGYALSGMILNSY